MKKITIKKIGKSRGLTGQYLKVFVEFFSRRFPDESDKIESYVTEWAERFLGGHPERYCDNESLAILTELKKKFGEVR